jgi:hypothetical protein
MNKEIKQKWLKALRSGRYKQAQNALHTESGYCCLGVLAKVQRVPNEILENRGFLEDDLVGYSAGLSRKSQRVLSRLNDKEDDDGLPAGKSFKEIADYIEKHYK